jgi:hypothetical protein
VHKIQLECRGGGGGDGGGSSTRSSSSCQGSILSLNFKNKDTGKVKVFDAHAEEKFRKSRGTAPLFLNLGPRFR